MPPAIEHSDEELVNLLQTDAETAIDQLFRRYYAYLCKSIYRIIPDANLVEDLSQEVFYELWKKREKINIQISIKAYLRRAARNKALNYIRDQRLKFEDQEDFPETLTISTPSNEHLEKEELEKLIEETIDSLPQRCRIVFTLSRFENMTYTQIATELKISPKTVEHQISKALKLLRKAVDPYLQE